MSAHESYMARALQLAERGAATTFPNPRVGCVIVQRGDIVGEGWHMRAGEAHAEVHALRAAGHRARGADVYVTLEPCSHFGRTPPCVDGLLAAGVARVIVAMADPDPRVSGRGIEGLRAAGIEVITGVLDAPARRLNRGFLSRVVRGRPFVTLKVGVSLDGRTAAAGGESRWITGEASRRDVHALRLEAGAVLTGSGTVIADDPALDVRHVPSPRVPDRIVIDSRSRVSPGARVWRDDGARRLWLTSTPVQAPPGVEEVPVPTGDDGRVSLPLAMSALGAAGINHAFVECGPRLAGALLDAALVDELLLYVAPHLLGDAAPGLATLSDRLRLAQRLELQYADVRRVGEDLRITAVPRVTAALAERIS